MLKQVLTYGFLFIYAVLSAQMNLEGYIDDPEGDPFEGVYIILEDGRFTTSNEQGYYVIKGISAGTHHVIFSCAGCKPVERDIDFSKNEVLDISMEWDFQSLDTLDLVQNNFYEDRKKTTSIKKIDQNYISEHSSSTLMNTLEKVEGVTVVNKGVGIAKPVIRGLGGNRVSVYDLGIKQEGQQWGSDHGLEIDQYHVEEIEIIKGANTLAYGSDAQAGVINLKPSTMHAHAGAHLGETKYFYRSVNQTNGLSTGYKGRVKDWIYKVRYTRSRYGDYRVPATTYSYLGFILPIVDERLKNTAGKEDHFLLSLGTKKKWGFSFLTFSSYNQRAGIFSGATGIPRAYNLTDDGDDRNIELPSQQINHNKIISNTRLYLKENQLDLDVGLQINRRKEFENALAHGFPGFSDTLGIRLDLVTVSLNAKYTIDTWKKWKPKLGIQSSLKNNQRAGFDFIIPAYQRTGIGVYSIFDREFNDKLYVSGGLRLDWLYQHADAEIMPFYHQRDYIDDIVRTPAFTKHYLNYSASAGLTYTPNKKLIYKVNVSKIFRTPNIAELLSSGAHSGTFRFEVGNQELISEQGYQLDVESIYKSKKGQVAISPYYNYYTNFIYLSPDNVFPKAEIDGEIYPFPDAGQLYRYRQGQVIHTGLEFSAYRFVHKYVKVGLNADYTYSHNIDIDFPLPFIPPASVKTYVEYKKEHLAKWIQKLYFRAYSNLYAAQNRVDRNEDPTEAYHTVDLSMGLDLGNYVDWLTFTIQINNLFNEKYFNHINIYRQINVPEPARNVSFTAAWKFHYHVHEKK